MSSPDTQSIRALSKLDTKSFKYRVINEQQIKDIIHILRMLTPVFADPAVRELEGLPKVGEFTLQQED